MAELSEVERILRMEETGAAGLVRLLRRAAQQRRGVLLAVRPAAARARSEPRDRRLAHRGRAARSPQALNRGNRVPQPKRPVT